MNKIVLFLLIAVSVFALFAQNQATKNSEIALVYKAERDSLFVTHRCPQPLRVQIRANGCLNTEAKRHDFDLHVSQLKTAANDTVAFAPLCETCFEQLSVSQRWPFYQKLIGLYEQMNRKDIEAQVKRGL